MGWNNHRANRLVDLANAHNSDYRPSAIAQGVEDVRCTFLAAPLASSLRRFSKHKKRARRRKNTRTHVLNRHC